MRSSHLLFSAIQFLFTVGLLLIGCFFVALPEVPQMRFAVADFFFYSTEYLEWIGYAIVACAFLLFLGFYGMYRKVYYQVQMAEVDPDLIVEYIKGYWAQYFPGQQMRPEVRIHSNQMIEVVLELGKEKEDLEEFLSRIERDLSRRFAKIFGYRKTFLLTVYRT